jgi:hypothetical protein
MCTATGVILGTPAGESFETHRAVTHERFPALIAASWTVHDMLDHPEFLDLLFDEVSVFSDADGDALVVCPGVLERSEMVDRTYLLLLPRLADGELTARLASAAHDDAIPAAAAPHAEDVTPLGSLAARVAWRSVVSIAGQLTLAPFGAGEPVTVLTLTKLVALSEIVEV